MASHGAQDIQRHGPSRSSHSDSNSAVGLAEHAKDLGGSDVGSARELREVSGGDKAGSARKVWEVTDVVVLAAHAEYAMRLLGVVRLVVHAMHAGFLWACLSAYLIRPLVQCLQVCSRQSSRTCSFNKVFGILITINYQNLQIFGNNIHSNKK